MEGLQKKGMAAAFCEDCDSGFLSSGRRVVDGIGEKHRPLPVDRSQVGLHNTASSPASPTKETVERLSLFLSVDPCQNKFNALGGNDKCPPRAFLRIYIYSFVLVTFTIHFGRRCRRNRW